MNKLSNPLNSLVFTMFFLSATLFFANVTCVSAADNLDEKISYNERVLAGLRQAARALEEVIEIAEDQNTWFYAPIPWPVPPVWMAREQMITYITWNYVMCTRKAGKLFDEAELARTIKFARDMSDSIKKQLPKELETIKKDIVQYENETSALMVHRTRLRNGAGTGSRQMVLKGSSKVCVEFVGVSRVGKLGELADVTGDPNLVRQEWNSPRGWRGDVTLEWTKPPAKICDGETFTFASTITNHRPYALDPGGTAGHLNFKPGGSAIMSIDCTNPDQWDPKSDVWLKAFESKKSNKCTVKLRIFGFASPAPLFEAGLSAGDTGIVYYNYRRTED